MASIKTGLAHLWRASKGPRQIKLLNRLLDGFDGKLTTSKYASIAKCSQDTALRGIAQLLEHGALKKSEASGTRLATVTRLSCSDA